MSAYEKERIFVELREYHLGNKEDFSSDESKNLAKEFSVFEEKAINMMLGFINGKIEYIDMLDELKTFEKKIADAKKGAAEKEDYEYLTSQAGKLKNILEMAGGSSFKVRPQRYRSSTLRNTSGITTTPNK